MTPQERLDHHIAQKEANDKRLDDLKSSDDIEVLRNWKSLGYPQPAPGSVQKLKNKTNLSWTKFRKFVEGL